MPSNEADRILTVVRRTIRYRKRIVAVGAIAVLLPIVIYNETTTKLFEASSSMIFDELPRSTPTDRDRHSRELLIFNRLEELSSYSFARDVAKALPTDSRARFQWPGERPSDFDEVEHMANAIHASTSAHRLSNSNVVRIRVEMPDAVLTQTIANTAVDVFKQRNNRVRQDGASGMRQFIEDQLVERRDRLTRSEHTLVEYKEANKITSFDTETKEILRRSTDAEVLLNEAVSKRMALERRKKSTLESLEQQRVDLVPTATDVGSPWAKKLKDRLLDLQLQAMELKVQNYPPTHPKLQQLAAEIDDTKQELRQEAEEIAGGRNVVDPIDQIVQYTSDSASMQIEIAGLRAEEKALSTIIARYDVALAELPKREAELARLTRERDANQQAYMVLLNKFEESKIVEAENIPSLRIIDTASLPRKPVKPRKKLNLALGMVLGLLTGFGVAFVLESMNRVVESTREVEERTGWPVLAFIPKIEFRAERARAANGDEDKKKGAGVIVNGKGRSRREIRQIERSLISVLAPESGPAEAFRMLRTQLQFLGFGTRIKSLLVTSLRASDGKSTTAANLAIGMASAGGRTLLIDAEVRRPGLHRVFDVPQEPGLAELLKRRNGARLSPRKTTIQNLEILPSGHTTRQSMESITRSASTMRAKLEDFKQRYDYVLIDTPPLILVHDTALLSSLADGVLFVVNGSRFDGEMLDHAKKMLETAGAQVVGAVLNDTTSMGGYEYYDPT